MSEFQKTVDQMTEMMKGAIPVIKANKNGYEIRTKVLEFAQNQVWQDYHAKWGAFETSISKENGEIVTKVAMPDAPGADAVLDTAQKFYDFVSGNKSRD